MILTVVLIFETLPIQLRDDPPPPPPPPQLSVFFCLFLNIIVGYTRMLTSPPNICLYPPLQFQIPRNNPGQVTDKQSITTFMEALRQL